MRQRLVIGTLALLAGILAGVLALALLDPLEDRVTAAKFHLRGPGSLDSSVAVVYIDNDAIATLGWPVHRNFYALMIRALSEFRARAIGIEVQFEQPGSEYPEYDRLLASVTASAGNVVLASYLGDLTTEHGTSVPQQGGDPAFRYPGIDNVTLFGTELHLPFQPLRESAAGIGHVNLAGTADIPLAVTFGTGTLPAFGVELLRVAAGATRDAVRSDGNGLVIEAGSRRLSLSAGSDGAAVVDVPLSARAIPAYPFLDVLKSYDAAKGGGRPRIRPGAFEGKIVLVGVIAEGRSPLVSTPVHPRLPSLLLHAAFVENGLHSGFLLPVSPWLAGLLCALVALAVAAGLLLIPGPGGKLLAWGALLAACAASVGLFLWTSLLLPLLPFVAAALGAAIPAFFYKHRLASERVDTLQQEKDRITAQLRDREAKVAVLERELSDAASRRSADRTQALREELQRYRTEIRELSAKADDMEAWPPAEGGGTGRAEFEGIVYDRSGRMGPVVEFISKIAPSEASVLILGESGTGKELVARALHTRSPRSMKPFVAVNCGALAETLLESELFGHEKGSFTGAVKDRAGRFELASGGTVFLDEIGDVSENFQVKLLRVLQEGEVERVGGSSPLRVDVRVIAATNKDLREQVRVRKFREDLFYRLNVLTVDIPPLRERQDDIPHIVAVFLERDGGNLKISRNVMDAFTAWSWPGNVRELESAVTRAVLLARADNRSMITMKDVSPEIAAALQGTSALEEQILQSVREKGFSRSAITETAAEIGGRNRGTVAEYVRGEFLRAFVEHGFRIEETVSNLSLSDDVEVNTRVRKRLEEYLGNIMEGVDRSQPWETTRPTLKPKMKNLPRRYHAALEQVAEAGFRGLWNAPLPGG